MYQNVQFIIYVKIVVLNFTTVKYPLH